MRTTARFVLTTFALVGLVAACGDDDDAVTGTSSAQTTAESAVEGDITVFAAASLTDAFTEIGTAFQAENPEATVTFNHAASSELVTQINEGAPADVYASADQSNMTKLVDAGGNADEPVVFATNLLEIVVAPGNPLGITGVADLADPDLVVVTCALEVPCGAYAAEIFTNAGVTFTADSYEENVRATLNKVVLGEADAGIVYASDVRSAGEGAAGVPIPADINVIAEYPIAVTSEAANAAGAAAFIDFVLGDAGQAILASYAFGPAP